jgi:hypothetical protein
MIYTVVVVKTCSGNCGLRRFPGCGTWDEGSIELHNNHMHKEYVKLPGRFKFELNVWSCIAYAKKMLTLNWWR